jgi:pyrroline-5-carboxylate reductase
MGTLWALIGGGNMARAIVRGGLDAGVLRAESVAIAEPDAAKRTGLADLTGNLFASGAEVVRWAAERDGERGEARVLLAVKPQMLGAVAAEIRPVLDAAATRRVVVSILAGTPTAKLEAVLGNHAAVVRVMPNTPAMIRQGTTAYCLGRSARPEDASSTIDLFRALGPVVEPIEETLMDAFTGVAGSGPAYLFYLAEAMVRGAVSCGFAPDVADRIVRQTLAGAGLLLAKEAELSPQVLRANVTSKGGTTAAATAVLDERAVMEAMERAIEAARDRGAELAKG